MPGYVGGALPLACEYTRGTGFPPPSSRPASMGRRASVAAVSSALRSFTCDRSCRLAGCSGTTPAECGEGTPGLCRQRYAAVHRELLPVCRRPWRSSDRVPSALSLRGALRRLDGPPIGGQGQLHVGPLSGRRPCCCCLLQLRLPSLLLPILSLLFSCVLLGLRLLFRRLSLQVDPHSSCSRFSWLFF
jgi:hypothetical protein